MKWVSFLSIFILTIAFSFVVLSISVHALTLDDIINSIISVFTGQSSAVSIQGSVVGTSGCQCCSNECSNVCTCVKTGCHDVNGNPACCAQQCKVVCKDVCRSCACTTPTSVTTTKTTTTTFSTTSSTTTTPISYIKSGKYVDVDWSTFPNNQEVADWGVKTGDDQYAFLAKIQNIPLNMMRSRTPVKLDNGAGGWASGGSIGVYVDWFFGKSLVSPFDPTGPSYGMTKNDYSLQRLDAEYYHELTHNIPKSCGSYCPTWFAENLGTWAQSAVSKPGAYTGIKASLEDALVENGAYTNPDAFGGYGRGAAFFWWLIERYGIDGLHQMIHQCFGYDYAHSWHNDTDIDTYGFVPWTGKTANQLAQDFYTNISSGWRANITKIMSGIDLNKISQDNATCFQQVNIRAQLNSCIFETSWNHGCYNTIPAKITVTYYKDGIQKTQTGASDFTIVADLESNITLFTDDASYTFVRWNDFGCWPDSSSNPHTYYLHVCAPQEINKRTMIGYFQSSSTTTTSTAVTTTTTISKPSCPYDCCSADDQNYQPKSCPVPAIPVCLGGNCPSCPIPVCQNNQCVSPPCSYTINYKTGWNLFSVPVKNVFAVSSTACSPASPIYGYSNGNYYQTTYVTGGNGYWVNMNSDCSETLTGEGVTINDFPYLNAGWNLIGAPSSSIILSDIIGTCNVVTGPFWYNPTTNSYIHSSTLDPTKGYFVKVSANCQLGSGLPPPPPQ